MLVDAVSRARVPGSIELTTLTLRDGRVFRCGDGESPSTAGTLCAGGRVVLPAFVDAHVHLDKAYLLRAAHATGPVTADLDSAIDTVSRLRGTIPMDVVRAGAERALGALVRHGTTAARAMVEIDPAVGLDLVGLHQALAADFADRLRLQLVAFPQRGLELPGMTALLTGAMAEGADVVGGCPYVDADPRRHLDIVFALAERHGVPVDLHLDFHDDPDRSLLNLVAERTRAHGMAGLVTIGHVTTLAAMASEAADAAFDQLAEAGINLVVLPATDLYLSGHGEPGTRSLAPIERAAAAGVRVAIANNNINNPFAPYGNASLVQAAWLAGITRRLVAPDSRQLLLSAITETPGEMLGLPPHGPSQGQLAHLAILDTDDLEDVVLQAAPVLATIRAGHLVSGLPSQYFGWAEG